MNIAAASLYWVIVALWLAVLVTLIVLFARNPRGFGATRLLLLVLGIDTLRNIVENIFFGTYWSAQFGVLPAYLVPLLGSPDYVLVAKLLNVLSGCLVLGVLLLRWLPASVRERDEALSRVAVAERQAAVFASTLDGASMPFLVMDALSPDHRVVFANNAYLKRAGKTAAEVIGQPWVVTCAAPEDAAIVDELRRSIAALQPMTRVLRWLRDDGPPTAHEVHVTPVADSHGHVQLITALCIEIEPHSGLAAERPRDSFVGQMAGSIAHDFNNLLTVMLGSLATVRDTLEPHSQVGMAVNVSMAAAQRSSRLARRLLDYSQNRAETTERVNVNGCIYGLQELITKAVAQGTRISLDLSPQRLICDIDAGRFEDALMNLCINASDAMTTPEGSGGKIFIGTSVEDEPTPMVVISVADTGRGMTPEVQAKAFERHFSTKPGGKGNGLGLSSVRDFVLDAGGTIELNSTPGVGTRVVMRLPRVIEASAATLNTNAPPTNANTSGADAAMAD